MRHAGWLILGPLAATACNASSRSSVDASSDGARATGTPGSGGGDAGSGDAGGSDSGGSDGSGGSGGNPGMSDDASTTSSTDASSSTSDAGGSSGSGASGGSGGSGGEAGAAAGDSGGSGGSGGACGTWGRGSCAEGSFARCIDGMWEPGDCRPCERLSCGVACCNDYIRFGMQINPFVDLTDALVDDFTIGDDEVTLQLTFTGDNQLGSIGFRMNETFNVNADTDLVVDYTATGNVRPTVSLEDGDSGCVFVMSGSVPNGAAPGCWDGFVGAPADAILPTNIINVRIESLGAGPASLTVRAVTF